MLLECHYSPMLFEVESSDQQKWNGCTVNRELRWIWDKVMNTARAAWQRVRWDTLPWLDSKVLPTNKKKMVMTKSGRTLRVFKNWRASWPWLWLTVCQLPLHGNLVCLPSKPPAGSAEPLQGIKVMILKSWVIRKHQIGIRNPENSLGGTTTPCVTVSLM